MKILFVCTGNTCRSPMAQALASHLAEKMDIPIEADSAGLMVIPGSKVSKYSVDAMMELGIDISSHSPKAITPELLDSADLILTMTKSQKDLIIKSIPFYSEKVKSLGEYIINGDIADPYGADFNTYKECASQIKDAIVSLYERTDFNE
ncbi:MAG: low molecular weight protein arginine phosphatase [Clostridia bacterium]|nr:low molecular weight protein arginine phosphatase [Clostridia bacterium]